MTIQILGLRPYPNEKGELKNREVFFDKGWRAPSVQELLVDIEKYIEPIPEDERWNLFYTVSHCLEQKGRKLDFQDVIPLDIDGCDLNRIDEYTPAVCQALDLEYGDIGVVFSGNGIQILVYTDETVKDKTQFDELRPLYRDVCTKINNALKAKHLPGGADTSVWSPARLMRLPMTENRKTPEAGYAKKNSIKQATIEQRVMATGEGITLKKLASSSDSEDSEMQDTIIKFPFPDSDFVQEECIFLKHCLEKQNDISEDNWYKMLSIVARLENGRELAHTYSSDYSGYTVSETDAKIDQALASSGPRTCQNIGMNFPSCQECKHYNKIASPILLKGPDYIGTIQTGFRDIRINKNGLPERGKVNQDDLVKFFDKQHPYICTPERIVYKWTGKYWEYLPDIYLEAFCEQHVDPKPMNNDCMEFKKKIFRTNLRSRDWFNDTTFKKINLDNGILDLSQAEPVLLPHTMEMGFQSVLPYSYDPDAKSKLFDRFMKDITMNRPHLADILLEYAGYAFANSACTRAKALILLGGGRNGKSTFMDVIKYLCGQSAFSTVSAINLDKDQHIALLEGKLFNITDETPTKAFFESSMFKNLVSGGDVTAKRVYKEPYTFKSRAKFIFSMNEMPKSDDTTEGMTRRFLMVPFEAHFAKGVNEDLNILDKMKLEASGILNRIIEGYIRLEKQINFTQSEEVDGEIQKYLEDNDSIYSFFQEHITVTNNTNEFITFTDMYAEFQNYCETIGLARYIPRRSQFSRRLVEIIPNGKALRERRNEGRGLIGVTLSSPNSDY